MKWMIAILLYVSKAVYISRLHVKEYKLVYVTNNTTIVVIFIIIIFIYYFFDYYYYYYYYSSSSSLTLGSIYPEG